MATVVETFETGPAGANITGGSLFTAYNTGTAVTFDSTQVKRGSLAAKVANTAPSEAYGAVSTLAGSNQFARFYVFVQNAVDTGCELAAAATGGSRLWRFQLTGAGNVRLKMGSTTVATGTGTFPTGRWVRVEVTANGSNLSASYFSGGNLEGATPDETITYATYTGGSCTRVYLGMDTAQSGANNFWFDDYAIDDTSMPAPTGSTGVVQSSGVTVTFGWAEGSTETPVRPGVESSTFGWAVTTSGAVIPAPATQSSGVTVTFVSAMSASPPAVKPPAGTPRVRPFVGPPAPPLSTYRGPLSPRPLPGVR